MIIEGKLKIKDSETIAWRHYLNNQNRLVIIVHGFYNSKDSFELLKLADCLSRDYDVFAFDLRGHGESSGFFSWSLEEGGDLAAVLDFLRGKYAKCGVIAFSFGGSIAINTIALRGAGIDSLVCVSAPCDSGRIDYRFWELDIKDDFYYTLFSRQGRRGKGARPGFFRVPPQKPIELIGKISVPVLYIHGRKDWVVRPWHSRKLYKNTPSARKKIVLIKNGPHAEYLLKCPSYGVIEEIKEWFKETL